MRSKRAALLGVCMCLALGLHAGADEPPLRGYLETDLQGSSDGVPLLFHDGGLDPQTVCKAPVSARTAREIERCNLVGLAHGPERFEAALAWSGGGVIIGLWPFGRPSACAQVFRRGIDIANVPGECAIQRDAVAREVPK